MEQPQLRRQLPGAPDLHKLVRDELAGAVRHVCLLQELQEVRRHHLARRAHVRDLLPTVQGLVVSHVVPTSSSSPGQSPPVGRPVEGSRVWVGQDLVLGRPRTHGWSTVRDLIPTPYPSPGLYPLWGTRRVRRGGNPVLGPKG